MDKFNPCQLLIPEIKQLIQDKSLEELKVLLYEINPIDLADALTQFTDEEQLLILRLLKPTRLITVFEEMDISRQRFVMERLENQVINPLLEGIPPELSQKLLNKVPKTAVKRMSKVTTQQEIQPITYDAEYLPETAGAVMRPQFLQIQADMTARAALEFLRANLRVSHESAIHALYVTSKEGILVGGLSLQTLISAPPEIRIRDIMTSVSPIRIQATADQEEAAKIFSKYKLVAAPVVDEHDRLVGILSADQVIKVIQEEATEDIQKLGAVEALDEPYFKIRFTSMVKKRGSWLFVLFIGEMFTATAMAFFEHEIAKAVVLALFVPLIISSGGNSGSQAATLIVRAMALKEVGFGDWWRVIKRELAAGLVLGSFLGMVGFLRITLWSQISNIYGPHYFLVGLTVASALILIVMWGTLCGSLLPMALKRVGLDPAVASAPFVATLVDVSGLVIYFGIASFILKGTLL